jgi:hypothetical protein
LFETSVGIGSLPRRMAVISRECSSTDTNATRLFGIDGRIRPRPSQTAPK